MSFEKVKRNILVVVIVMVAAAGVAFGVVFLAQHFTPDNPGIGEVVDNTAEPEITPIPTREPDREQQVIIEQDRTLKFDNIVKGIIGQDAGVATVTKEEYMLHVDAGLEQRLVQQYEETEGFTCHMTEMFAVLGYASGVMSMIDGSNLTIEELYFIDKTFDQYIEETPYAVYPHLAEHESEWKLPFKSFTRNDAPEGLPDWTWSESGQSQVIGIGHLDFSNMGYEDAIMVMTYFPQWHLYASNCYLKVNNHRWLRITCDSDPINMVGYVTELIQNCLVVF